MTTLAGAVSRLADDIVSRAVRTVVHRVGELDGGPLGEPYDRWAYGDPSTRRAPYEPHRDIDGTVVRRGDDFPRVAPDGGAAHPGDHPGDQCEVIFDSVRVTVAGRTVAVAGGDDRRVEIVVSAPDDPAVTRADIRAAAQVVRDVTGVSAARHEAERPSRRRSALTRIAGWVRGVTRGL